jgi:hypothetical protein
MRGHVVLLALALLAPACGDADPKPVAKPPATITVDEAIAVAKAGLLRKADLPGWRADKPDPENPDDALEAESYRSCFRDGESLADRGIGFSRGDLARDRQLLGIESDVTVVRNPDQTRSDLAYVGTADFRDCLEQAFQAVLADEKISAPHSTIRPLAVRVPGATGATAFVLRMVAEYEQRRLPLRITVVFAGTGEAEVVVIGMAFNTALPSTARLVALTAKSVKRTKTALAA